MNYPNKQRFIGRKQNDRHNTGYWTIAKIAGMVPSYVRHYYSLYDNWSDM
jgi:hypothetical protein